MITSSSPTLLDEGRNMARAAYFGITYLDTIQGIEAQLQKRLSHPATPWGQKQTDEADKLTKHVYYIAQWDALLGYLERATPPELHNYAVNRWFNHWSAKAVEMMFCSFEGVEANVNKYDRLVDFTLHGVTFDHKTSVWPRGYPYSPAYAKKNPLSLVDWLYKNQSSNSSRKHFANRLFIVLYSDDGQHWRLRADLTGLYEVIEQYVNNFDPTKLLQVGQAKSDIIWFESKSNW